jgi:hypothetical protein
LPPDSEVFDAHTWRATMITGRLTRVINGNKSYDYAHSLDWEQLKSKPTPEGFLDHGFRYVYIDEAWWSQVSEASRSAMTHQCVQVVSEQRYSDLGQFRRLLDLEQCRQ